MCNNRTNCEKIDIARVQEYIDDVFKEQKSISIINEVLKEIAKNLIFSIMKEKCFFIMIRRIANFLI